MAKFLVKSSSVLTARNSFVLLGEILEGEVDKGMYLISEVIGDHHLIVTSVEDVRIEEQYNLVGLLFNYTSKDQMNYISSLENRIVTIDD